MKKNGNDLADFDFMDNQVEPQTQFDLQAPLLDRIDSLIAVARNSQLKKEWFDKYGELIRSVAADLQLNEEQTMMLMPFVANSDEVIPMKEVKFFFDCTPTTIMRYNKTLSSLVHRRYIHRGHVFGGSGFGLTQKATKALSDGKGLREQVLTGLNPNDFMNALANLFNEYTNMRNCYYEEFDEELKMLLANNRHLEVVKAFDVLNLEHDSLIFLLFFCKQLVDRNVEVLDTDDLSDLVENFGPHARTLHNGHHELIKKKLIAFSGSDQLYRDMFSLTPRAKKKLLKEYDIVVENREETDCSRFKVVKACEVMEKQLFYSEKNQKEIDVISKLLSEKKFQEVRHNFQSNGLRQGFNCLFYGAPGTGKTETVLQLARTTGRDIMQVDISTVRNKWYGETEKIVKDIFDQYGKLVKHCKRTPILLFNEADAILSVRSEMSGSHSTDKTENAIQNIMLQEMENLEGIMIATTNLADNLDKAFERRFIYKVRFEQPSIEAKAAIWKSQLVDLSDSEAETLAGKFDFSGGQIENVSRKVFVEKTLFGMPVSFDRLVELCEEEKLDRANARKAIGFRA